MNSKILASHNYTILEKITIEEAVSRLKNRRIVSKRFFKVMKLGNACKGCGLERSYVALGRDKGNNLHWDLYAEDGTLMTIDHIIPRAKGGKEHMKNLQLMCSPCNFKKADNHEN